VARDLLVFQSMLRGQPGGGRVDGDYPFSETAIFDEPSYPRLHFVERNYAGDPTNWWIPNEACAVAMLRSAGFSIESHPEAEVFICRTRDVALPGQAAYPARRKYDQ
jgi:tRNA (mo5U34)-methyltransferase